jgi:hypothetical protein
MLLATMIYITPPNDSHSYFSRLVYPAGQLRVKAIIIMIFIDGRHNLYLLSNINIVIA